MSATSAARFNLFSSSSTRDPLFSTPDLSRSSHLFLSTVNRSPSITTSSLLHLSFASKQGRRPKIIVSSTGDGGNGAGDGGFYGGGGGEGGGDEGGDAGKNRTGAMLALAEIGWSLDTLPSDMAAAIQAGRIPDLIVKRYAELEKSGFFRWFLQFGGFKERLLADELFLHKITMEIVVGMFAKTAAEYNRRGEKFFKELDFVIADVVMAIIADFMLVWLPAPTVSLRPPLAISAGPIAKFFHTCPDNAFQIALRGTSYSFLQRIGAIARNGAKLFVVGTSASMVGTGVTNALIKARKAVNTEYAGEVEDVPILSTSVAYGVYMAVSSNLRYQLLAGVVEQRILEPLLHQHKLMLSAMCFAVRTGNTYLGSLMWVDYARWVGVQ
ncbi:protein RETICULATA-RELATED 4, chloroplastic-like protein [Cinnamomum micranthum f. kanehirae]|uniref:Protein RETICULATA-RELATED 4, chloroplastic-like protein n=1 Tax=Cinnamomum micranthum f. kanehirae TaxID=337451 RepID=A0A443PX79_9MAGN|nr:protein RETICULATA-RELATED 4, chloroplastic-like protein [Cinnamomum micranthum f. kanehirae]